MGIQLANGNTFFIFKKTGVIDIERSLDYFYGQAGELFSFYRIPKALFQEPQFQNLSTDAKTLYGIAVLRTHIANYAKTRPTYDAYRKAREEMQELVKAQKNIELFFAEEKDTHEKQQTR